MAVSGTSASHSSSSNSALHSPSSSHSSSLSRNHSTASHAHTATGLNRYRASSAPSQQGLTPVQQGEAARAADAIAKPTAPVGNKAIPQKVVNACAFTNGAGMCVYTRGPDGKLHNTPEHQKQICKNYAALQDGAAKTNDGLTAVGVAGGVKGGLAGTIIGGLSTFGAFISSVTTGSGFRPFGVTIIPKSSPPPGC